MVPINKLLYGGWCFLGFIRGINNYVYLHKTTYGNTKQFYYLDTLGAGILGALVYAVPVTLPFTLYKEAYRLEAFMRNLNDEKQSDFYNTLL
jgi:hypothetical protein